MAPMRIKNISMKKVIHFIFSAFVIAALLSSCGVKGKPQAPLKKGEAKNDTNRKQNP
jgi:hypothetical protein